MNIPQIAINAALAARAHALIDRPTPIVLSDEALTRIMLEAAEAVWPHDPPKRDPASVTHCGTERAAVPSKRDHAAAWSGIGFNTSPCPGDPELDL